MAATAKQHNNQRWNGNNKGMKKKFQDSGSKKRSKFNTKNTHGSTAATTTNKRRKVDIYNAECEQLAKLVANYDWSQFDTFDQIPLSNKTKNGLRRAGYHIPTDIQRQSIGFALNGEDVLGAAKTGSGKTLAFLIPMLECLYRCQWTTFDGLGALIISPTRELSYQIFEVLNKIGGEHDFSVGLIIGGKDLKFESKRMDRCNIVVCTPGRLLQHMDENPLFTCDNLKMLILDEADRILDLGFAKTMNAIIENLPSERQTLLFSATQTKSVKDLARLSLHDPVYVSSHEKEQHSTPSNLIQSYITCELAEKINILWSFIRQHTKQKIIVFMSSCKQVKFIYELFCLLRPGIPLLALYGTLHQMRRMQIYDRFCAAKRTILFATDIASRGLDFPSVNWVIQLDCPEDVRTYIHRVGRTARFEQGGESLLILLPSEEQSMVAQLTQQKVPIEKIAVNPRKMTTIVRKTEAALARNVALKECAQRAFKAYLKNVFLMKDKTIFQYDKLNLDSFARSLGLINTPRVRFIERKQAQNANKSNQVVKQSIVPPPTNDSLTQSTKDDVPTTKFETNNQTDAMKDKFDFENAYDEAEDNDDNDDLFQVKKVWHFDQTADDDDDDDSSKIDDNDTVSVTASMDTNSKKAPKSISKAALAKRLLKKNIQLNTKVVFDDECNQIPVGVARQVTLPQFISQEATVQSGIDIELSKKIMQEEDKFDKQHYRELIREKHLAKKLKMKAAKAAKKKSSNTTDNDDDDDDGEGQDNEDDNDQYDDQEDYDDDEEEEEEEDEDPMTSQYIDALPDPDKYYGPPSSSSSGDEDSDLDESEEEAKEEEEEEEK